MKRYDNIQLPRVIACLGVFAAHLAPKMGAEGTVARIANFGASGVYLFFLISGFLACESRSLLPGAEGDRKGKAILSYYIKRCMRLLPLYYAVILYNFLLHTFLLRDVTPDPAGLGWLRYLLLLNAFLPAPDNFWANLSATWTVSLFLIFYLCAPFLLRAAGVEACGGRSACPGKCAGRARPESHASRQSANTAQPVDARSAYPDKRAGSVQPAGHSALPPGQMDQTGTERRKKLPEGVLRAALLYGASLLLQQIWVRLECSDYMMIFYYLHFFILGILVWQLSEHYRPAAAVVRLVLLFVAAAALLFLASGSVEYFTVISWIYALVLAGTINFTWEGRLKQAVKGLDGLSYSIYLVHAVVVDGIVLLKAHVTLSGPAVFVIGVGLTAVGAWAANRLIERPAQQMGKIWISRLASDADRTKKNRN